MSVPPANQRQQRNDNRQVWGEKREAVLSGDKGERKEPEGFHGPAVITRLVTGTEEKTAPPTGLSAKPRSTGRDVRFMTGGAGGRHPSFCEVFQHRPPQMFC